MGLRTGLVIWTILISCHSLQAQTSFVEAWPEIRDWHLRKLQESGVVGSSFAIVHDGEVKAAEYHGYADLDSKRKVDKNTIYHWGSVTKTLTGIAIMQLRDLRKLELDDPVVDYVPELHQVHNPFGDIREITIRHVMSHSAGFRASTWPWGGGESWHPHEPTNWDQLVAMFPYTKINFKPGSRFSYSNPGIILLGRIVELLSHEDYETYVDKNIFKPLGMHRSYFDLTPRHLLQHRSNNYTVRDGARTANGLDFDTGITVSNSGLNSPFPDMVRYVNFLLGVGEGPSILKRSSLEEMWRVHQPVPNGNVPEGGMGLIFFILRSNDLRVIGHTGSQKAFQAFLWIAPDKKAGALAAFNTVGISTDGQPAQPATRAIMTELQEKVFSQLFRAAF